MAIVALAVIVTLIAKCKISFNRWLYAKGVILMILYKPPYQILLCNSIMQLYNANLDCKN